MTSRLAWLAATFSYFRTRVEIRWPRMAPAHPIAAGIPRVVLREYTRLADPFKLAVGDIIRCDQFRLGLRRACDASGEIVVAWKDESYPAYHASVGNGTLAHDASRGLAPFLVTAITLVEGTGPDDICPWNHRLSREVDAVRLERDFAVPKTTERVRFNMDEPMSVVRPQPGTIEVLGFAELPISWDQR